MWSIAGTAQSQSDLVRVFADCAGRFSAELEHAWLLGDADAERWQEQRLAFVSLLDATVLEGDRRSALNHRIETKLAHAALLTQATFSENRDRATSARTLANRYVLTCSSLLLKS